VRANKLKKEHQGCKNCGWKDQGYMMNFELEKSQNLLELTST